MQSLRRNVGALVHDQSLSMYSAANISRHVVIMKLRTRV